MSDPFEILKGGLFGGSSKQAGISGFWGIPSIEEMQQASGAQYGAAGQMGDIIDSLLQSAQQQYSQGQTGREAAIKRAEDILGGRFDPASSPMYGPMRGSLEGAYGGAKENILSALPKGGTQQQALADLETTRGQNLSDLMGNILQGEYQNAYGVVNQPLQNYMQLMGLTGQPSANWGQMLGSIMEFLANRTQSGYYGASGLSPM